LRPGMAQISGALEELKGERDRPSGRLRIYAQPWAVPTVIAPMWQHFLSCYPDVHLDLLVGSEPSIDIVASGLDAGLAVRERVPVEMTAIRASAPMRAAVVASPDYLAKRAAPNTPDDLLSHQCVQYRNVGEIWRWRFEQNGNAKRVSVRGSMTVNDTDAAIRAALDGLGIAYTLDVLVEPFLRSGQLVRVLADWSPNMEGVYLYYNGRRQLSAALRAFINLIRSSAGRRDCRCVKNPF
jgi:DNA-binding transcriptional LysR family regulator